MEKEEEEEVVVEAPRWTPASPASAFSPPVGPALPRRTLPPPAGTCSWLPPRRTGARRRQGRRRSSARFGRGRWRRVPRRTPQSRRRRRSAGWPTGTGAQPRHAARRFPILSRKKLIKIHLLVIISSPGTKASVVCASKAIVFEVDASAAAVAASAAGSVASSRRTSAAPASVSVAVAAAAAAAWLRRSKSLGCRTPPLPRRRLRIRSEDPRTS